MSSSTWRQGDAKREAYQGRGRSTGAEDAVARKQAVTVVMKKIWGGRR
jgi:hypothetical protein